MLVGASGGRRCGNGRAGPRIANIRRVCAGLIAMAAGSRPSESKSQPGVHETPDEHAAGSGQPESGGKLPVGGTFGTFADAESVTPSGRVMACDFAALFHGRMPGRR